MPASVSVVFVISREQSLVTDIWSYSPTCCRETSPRITREVTLLNRMKNQSISLQLASPGEQGKVTLAPFLTKINKPSPTVRIKEQRMGNRFETAEDFRKPFRRCY